MRFVLHHLRRLRRERLPPGFWILWGALLSGVRLGPGVAVARFREGRLNRSRWRRATLVEPGAPIRFPAVSAPRVSIVIPVHDRWTFTYNCLRSLTAVGGVTSFEVVVVDNASRDATAAGLAACENLTVLRQEENLGFVGGCNLGIAPARGELILLLNNDTQVEAGWLDRLVAVLDEDRGVGVVGPKLLFPNGRLQEAGNAVFRDGTATNLGKFDDPWRSEFCVRGEVDYVSGAALLIRADLLKALGGLDERYSPGFWEDADLCFAAHERGFRVVTEPEAIVFHFEGSSSWRQSSGGEGWSPASNAHLFRERWADRLRQQPEAGSR